MICREIFEKKMFKNKKYFSEVYVFLGISKTTQWQRKEHFAASTVGKTKKSPLPQPIVITPIINIADSDRKKNVEISIYRFKEMDIQKNRTANIDVSIYRSISIVA